MTAHADINQARGLEVSTWAFFFFFTVIFFKKIAISTTKMAKRAKAPKTEKDQNMIGANGRKNDSNNTGKTVGWQHFLLTHFGEKKSIFGVQKIY